MSSLEGDQKDAKIDDDEEQPGSRSSDSNDLSQNNKCVGKYDNLGTKCEFFGTKAQQGMCSRCFLLSRPANKLYAAAVEQLEDIKRKLAHTQEELMDTRLKLVANEYEYNTLVAFICNVDEKALTRAALAKRVGRLLFSANQAQSLCELMVSEPKPDDIIYTRVVDRHNLKEHFGVEGYYYLPLTEAVKLDLDKLRSGIKVIP